MFELNGRVALVTGGGQNQGAGICRYLAALGAAVAVNDLVPERAAAIADELRVGGASAIPTPFDVTRIEQVRAGIAEAERALGPVEVLVNNAGVPPGMGIQQFRETDPGDWQQFIDLNIYGVMNCCHVVIGGMRARGFGRIITITSGAGQTGLAMGISAYGAGKGGQIAFMRHLALENADSGVTANTVSLGLMSNTEGSAETEGLARTIPVGRLGRPSDVGAAVAFFASNEAEWITGQTLGVNGGNLTN
jgi:NAD(P)-dependent dehydrogenase (short-subunit alcohol dehydrogenase family)